MAKNIKIKIDVDSEQVEFAGKETLTLTEQVRALRKELQRVPEGTKEWTLLQQKYNETKDSLDRVNVKSKELFGTFAALPGPIGNISSQLDNTIGTLKLFSGIKLSDISSQFAELGKDIVSMAKNFANLTGITKVYTLLNNALAASFVKVGVGEAAAATGARAFAAALTATGIGAIVVALGLAVSALMDYFDASKQAEKAANDYSDAIKRQNELLEDNLGQIDFESKKKLLQAKIAGESETNLNKITEQGLQQRYDLIKNANTAILNEQRQLALKQGKYAKMSDEERAALAEKNVEQMQKLGEQESKAREAIELNKLQVEADFATKSRDNAKKAGLSKSEDAKKQRESDIKELEKAEAQALLVLVSNKEKELGEVDLKYNELIAKEEKYGRSTKVLTDARETEKKVIREKYAQEEKDYIDKALAEVGDKQKNARNRELSDAQQAYKKLYDQKVLAKEETTALDNAYAQQVLAINKKYDEEELKQKDEFFGKVRDIEIAAGQNQTQRLVEARQKKLSDDIAEIEKEKEFIKLTEEEKNTIRKNLATAAANDITKINLDAATKAKDDELRLLELKGQALQEGTRAYFLNQEALLKAAYEKELLLAQDNAEKKKAIEDKYQKDIAALKLQEFTQTLQYMSQGLEAAKGVANAITAVNENRMNDELKAAGEDEAKKEEIKKKYFEKNKKTQIALAYINTFQSAVAAFASMASIPVVGPALGAVAAAAAIVAGLANVAKIKASTYEGSNAGGGSSSAAPATAAMTGPAQAQVPTQEKSTVSSQGSLANIIPMNQPKAAPSPNIGSAVSSTTTQAQATGQAVGQAVSNNDRPIQTYVVGSQVSSQQQLDRRVALAAKMPG